MFSIEQKLDMIIERLDRLEKKIHNSPSDENTLIFTRPEKNYMDVIKEFNMTNEHMNKVFSTNIYIFICDILCEIFYKHDSLKAFLHLKNKIYGYENGEWIILDKKIYENIIYCLEKKIISSFVNWTKTMTSDQQKNYEKYSFKIYCVKQKDITSKVKKEMYKKLCNK